MTAQEGKTEVRRYAERNIFALDKAGGYYGRHVSALTAEKLHSKSDIAAELGYRDQQIDALRREVEELKKRLEMYGTLESGERVELTEECDGIACRDSTIELLDGVREGLIDHRDRLMKACDAAVQCIGDLSPTQARVEAMQMLQAALTPDGKDV